MNVNKVLDAKGLACPMPLVKTKKALNEVNSGGILEVITTDKGAKTDLAAWCKATGNELLDMKEENDVFTFYIKKA
ncbi:sulfurtransferase TusA family protein [Sutcliffiella horikoshii]|uniref:Sulfurtransferase TusA family protein n=1 Tax=Sutcliffiella horikoshii TaxID=79883 RepID=A0AA95B7L8_9BACI|nr:sulfurtransferase TusA family protein [Sutcliffiella horikoshii]TYS60124.1 sulfurtransferase TusA family protein [Sutcliffiella horikoshii]